MKVGFVHFWPNFGLKHWNNPANNTSIHPSIQPNYLSICSIRPSIRDPIHMKTIFLKCFLSVLASHSCKFKLIDWLIYIYSFCRLLSKATWLIDCFLIFIYQLLSQVSKYISLLLYIVYNETENSMAQSEVMHHDVLLFALNWVHYTKTLSINQKKLRPNALLASQVKWKDFNLKAFANETVK